MTREEAIKEINRVFEPAFANYIIIALTEGATPSDKALKQQPCEDWHGVPSDEMTLEQARQAVKDLRKMLPEYLEQNPYEDVVSRKAVLDQAVDYGSNTYLIPVNSVKALPPVNPQPKTGKWIEKWDSDHLVILAYECSKCGMMMNVNTSHYCPNCGAKMAESEDKE